MRPTWSLAWLAKNSAPERLSAATPLDDPLVCALLEPARLIGLDTATWLDLLARARRSGLLRRLAALSEESGILERLPEAVQRRFAVERLLIQRNRIDISFELYCVRQVLQEVDSPIVVLKGAAYLLGDLPLGRRRMCADLDVMVPKTCLGAVESALIAAGWSRAEITTYDDHYYRTWMHELPPLLHPERGIMVDLHHTIYPPTGRYEPSTDALFAAAVPNGDSCLKILCPADMVLHCGLHVFAGELMTGLSDLTDLHELLQHFGQDEKFWDQLLARTRLHGLERILYYMLRYTKLVLGTAFPLCAERAAEIGAPPAALGLLMDVLFKSALLPPRAAGRQPGRTIAVRLLHLRAHWLKMPLRLLAYHFCRKMLQGRQNSPTHSTT
jgi:hypothetical protein